MLPNISAQGVPVIDANGLPLVGDDCCCDGEFPCCEGPAAHPDCPQQATLTIAGVAELDPLINGCPGWCLAAINGTWVLELPDKVDCCRFRRDITPHIDCNGNFDQVIVGVTIAPNTFDFTYRTFGGISFFTAGVPTYGVSNQGDIINPWTDHPACLPSGGGVGPAIQTAGAPVVCDITNAIVAIGWSI